MNKKFFAISIGMVFLLAGLASAFMHYDDWGYHMGGGFFWMGILGFIVMALILIALVLFILWLIKQLQKK